MSYGEFDPKAVDAFRATLRRASRDWLREEIEAGAREVAGWPRASWPEKKAAARRRIEWADAVEPPLLDQAADLVPALADLRRKAEEVAVYSGDFTLRVYVRGASLAGLRRGGAALPLPEDPESPLSLALPAGEYEVELRHPAEGSGAVKLRGEPGRTLTLVGPPNAPRVAAE